MDKMERPYGITLIAILLIIIGIIGLFVLILSLVGITDLTEIVIFGETRSFEIIAIYYAISIVLLFIIGYGFIKGLKWSWYFAIILTVYLILELFLDIIIFDKSLDLFSIWLYPIILLYLSTSDIRAYFKIT